MKCGMIFLPCGLHSECIKILDWYHANGRNQKKTTEHFILIYPNLRIKQPLVSLWLKEEAKWQEQWAQGDQACTAKCIHQTQHPDMTEMLELWVVKVIRDKVLITGEVLWQKWTKFADLVGIPEDEHLNLSEGWLVHFKARNGLREFRHHGKAASADPERVEREKKCVQELIKKYGYELRDISNMDKSQLFYGWVLRMENVRDDGE